jgi:hypothetical protein
MRGESIVELADGMIYESVYELIHPIDEPV